MEGALGIEAVYSEVLYSEVEDRANPYEVPTAIQAHSSRDFDGNKGGLPAVDDQSLWRVSAGTINQPALDQEVCVRACVRACVYSIQSYLTQTYYDSVLCCHE